MKHNCAKKIAGGCFALAMTFALAQPMLADDLNTEMASAGAQLILRITYQAQEVKTVCHHIFRHLRRQKTKQQRLKAKRQQTKTNYFQYCHRKG